MDDVTPPFSSRYMRTLLEKNPDSTKRENNEREFLFHVKRDVNVLARRYLKSTLFYWVLKDGSNSLKRCVVKEIKDQREYLVEKDLSALRLWMTDKSSETDESTWVDVLTLFGKQQIVEDDDYFRTVCKTLETTEGWIDFVEFIGVEGCEKIAWASLNKIACFGHALSSACIPAIMTKDPRFCNHETLLRLAFVTRHVETLKLFKREDLGNTLETLNADNGIVDYLSKRCHSDLELAREFNEAVYRRLFDYKEFTRERNELRQIMLASTSDMDGMYFVVDVDRENGVVYRENEYIFILLKTSTSWTTIVRQVFADWYKHYGHKANRMYTDTRTLFRLSNNLSPDKNLGVWFERKEDGSYDTRHSERRQVDVGICLFKGYIQHRSLFNQLVQHQKVDFTVHSGNSHRSTLAVRSRDLNPFIDWVEKKRKAEIVLILNQLPPDTLSVYVTKRDLAGRNPLSCFINSGTCSIYKYLEGWTSVCRRFYDRVVCRMLENKGDVKEILDDMDYCFTKFLVLVVVLFGESSCLTSPISKACISETILTDVHIVKKMMQRGGDISFLGDLFADYQSYYYAKRMMIGNTYEKGLCDKVASFLDVRLAFDNPFLLQRLQEARREDIMPSDYYTSVANIALLKLTNFKTDLTELQHFLN